MGSLSVLATMAAKAAVILGLAFVVIRGLRGASAAVRHLVWTVAFTTLLVMAVADFYRPQVELPSAASAESVFPAEGQRNIRVQPTSLEPINPYSRWMVAIWIGGVLLTALRLLLSLMMAGNVAVRPALATDWYATLQQLRRRLRIRREVELLVTHDASIPMTWGAFRPVVILPASAAQWSQQQLEMVVAHELAHVKRWDWATQLIGYACASLYWFFPPVWLALQQSRKERERACDDVVLKLGARPSEYADHLVHLAKSVSQLSWSAAVAMAQESHLENRVVAMLDARTNRSALRWKTFATTCTVALVCLMPLLRFTWTRPELRGVVFDPSGAVVPGAVVALVSPVTRYTALSGPDGAFTMQGVPHGSYAFEVMHPGFRRFRSAPLSFEGGQTYRIHPVLAIGRVHESLQITSR